MKTSDALSKMTVDKLREESKTAEKNLYVLKMKLSMWELKQTHLVKTLKRYIAKVRTYINTVNN